MGVGPFHLPALLAEAGEPLLRHRPKSGAGRKAVPANGLNTPIKGRHIRNFPSFERHAVQMLLYGRPSLKAAALRTVCQTVVAGFKRSLPEYHAGCQCLRGPGA